VFVIVQPVQQPKEQLPQREIFMVILPEALASGFLD
jgi:hypothetical protein